jgi:hypothetical protein
MAPDRIVAVGLLTQTDLNRLGEQFARAWPVQDTGCFESLIDAIDQADRRLWREEDSKLAGSSNSEAR